MVGPPLNPVPNIGGTPVIDNIPRAGRVDLATRYFGRRSVRDTWVALCVLWLLWACLFLAKQFFDVTRMMEARRSARVTTANGMQDGSVAAEVVGGPHDSTLPTFASDGDDGIVREDSNTAPVATITHPAARPNQGFFDRAMEGILERIDMAYGLARDLTLMLLFVEALNTFGLGSEIAMLILVWVYVSIALFWASLMLLLESRIVNLVLGSIEMLLLLAMLIAAYTIGWTTGID